MDETPVYSQEVKRVRSPFYVPLFVAIALTAVSGCNQIAAPPVPPHGGSPAPLTTPGAGGSSHHGGNGPVGGNGPLGGSGPSGGGGQSGTTANVPARHLLSKLAVPAGQVFAYAAGEGQFEISLEAPRKGAQSAPSAHAIKVNGPTVGNFILEQKDLPGHPKAIVAGQAPYWAAYDAQTLAQLDYPALTAPPAPGPGTQIIVDKGKNILYFYKQGKLVKCYHVATGRQIHGPVPTWNDYMSNYFTPEGHFAVAQMDVNPTYSSHGKTWQGGAADNPLGTRWIGFPVLAAANGKKDSGYIWAIHGTNEPDKIGSYVSDGCIRMFVPDVEELFAQVTKGTPVTVINSAR